MLRVLRESAGSWIIKVLMGIMVAAFVLVGTGSYKAYRTSKVAKVNGENISMDEYQQAYYNILENIRRQFGDKLNDEMLKMLNIQQQALDQVIEITLLRQTAEKNKIRVSDRELADAIVKIPAFQDNGKFDATRYKQILSQNRMTPSSFEGLQKEAMLMDKLKSIITSSAKVSEDEGRKWYLWESASVKIAYVCFTPDASTDLEITDAMIEEYYNAHKEAYTTEPARKARYVKFDPAGYKDRITVTDDEIQQYYMDHEEEFKVEETLSPLEKVSDAIRAKLAAQKAKNLAYDDALSLYDSSLSSDDLINNAAGRKLELVTTDFFNRSSGPPDVSSPEDFVKIAFELPIMEISDVAEIGESYYIIQVIEEQPEQIPLLEAVKDKVREDVLAEQQEKAAETTAKEFLEKAKEKGGILPAAQDSGIQVQRVTLANRNTPPPQEIENEATVVEASFNLSGMSKMPENPVKGLRGYYVIELEKRDEPMTEAYTTLKSHFINRLLMKKQSELYRTWVENLRKHSKIEISERMLNQTGI